ncbi:hypothetical protein O2N63_05685 [Aliiroseovarius sp. KMU-50]|uniref:Uncharacterized protein n=1 Tax=Aliiroseovarius salicola TaxID=3009082 RepID=A0ABT4VZ87_9RHOB|nr:hypothetical protein [Aliiroseovarius sp. KMU-50]MDA5093577.1 hypothetical protein [Aliiroseovarius sp. KMU-50]
MKYFAKIVCIVVALSPVAAQADDVTDTLESAITAYGEGDLKYALEELEYAKQLIQSQNTASLAKFLPDAPDGWSREISTEMTAGMGFLGGGAGAEATYTMGSDSFSIVIMADNPMVGALAGMMGNAGLLGMKLQRVGRMKYLDQDGELSGVINNRILIQAEGAASDVMIPVLETIDIKALSDYGN